ncbi:MULTISPECIES: SusC/RagA family TonB-linked outer membrane protein [Niastella]|uniref:TonB-dependent receptor n=1 Tax=Niastella soli TaxID=2821487 RepID=A0ABS3Z2J8_9BACT|nr:TonB-dependent receptor [Niastella soli]MBO9204391.1 TonB-dependent receptor [Niastella soli]
MRQFLQLTIRAACYPLYRTAPKLLFLTFFLLTNLALFAQSAVQGRVMAGDAPLAGVSVTIKGTQTTTVTDAEGKFTIQAPEKAILVFTHVNYAAQEVAVTGSNLEVTLSPANTNLSEVVVIGYNAQKKATLTGSVSVVKGTDLVKSPQANVSNSLAGRFSGVILNNRSGEPGYDGSGVTVRGLATTGNNDVLVVVDGVPGQIGGMERLNPNDIESISVLKDASAAIYGSRAANGVILVTTKRGKTGKPSISASYNHGFSSPTRLPEMADAQTYAQISNEIAYYNNPAGGLNQQYSAAEIQKFADGSDPLNYPNTDWAKTTLKNSTGQDQANVSIAGGSDNIRYYLSAGLLGQDGLYKNGATKYNQYSFRSNIDASITKDFKVSLYLSGREEDRQFPAASSADIFRSIYRAYATLPAFYPNGLPSTGIEGNNPAMMATSAGGLNKNPGQVFNGILKSSYNIAAIKGLSVEGFAAVDKSWYFTKTFATPYLLYSYDKANDVYNSRIVGGNNNAASLNESQKNQTQLTTNIRLNYANSFGQHNLNAFVGYEQSELKRDSLGASRINFPTAQTPELTQGGTAATDRDNGGNSYHYTRKSYLGKLSYNYAEKYLFDAQLRIDGSSTFPSGNRYGYFPSFSAGWRISNESFLHNVSFINDLKVRASYGMLGNDNVALFQYLHNYTFNTQVVLGSSTGYNIAPAIDLTKLANKQIHWEEARKTDLALEGVVFNNFNFEFIYFRQQRTNILATRNASLPAVTGIVNPYGSDPLVPSENIGEVNSNGIEASLGYNNRKGKFHYGASGNITYAKSKIVFIDEAPAVLSYQKQTGRPLNTSLLYNSLGIFRSTDEITKYPHLSGAQPGDLILQDVNEDGKITADDQVRTKYGNIPEITYGILLNADYSSFDISIVFAGQTHVSQFVLPESGTVGNFYSSWADNRWSPSNINGAYPRVDTRTSASVNGGLYPSTFWLNNASFLRLKNIELGYTVAKPTLTKMKMQSLRVYLSAFNLFTITKVKDYDPEGNQYSGQFYPQQRIVNLGVALQF